MKWQHPSENEYIGACAVRRVCKNRCNRLSLFGVAQGNMFTSAYYCTWNAEGGPSSRTSSITWFVTTTAMSYL